MILIVGLGNPGTEYEDTLHNCGFMVVDLLAKQEGIKLSKNKCKSKIFEGQLFGKKVVLAKPQTFMNNSGEAVVELMNAFKPETVLIVYDDIDIPFGTTRFRKSGSAGTHNGMRNIVALTKTTEIPRLRIGTQSDEKPYSLADYVLSRPPKDKKELLTESIFSATETIQKFIENDGKVN